MITTVIVLVWLHCIADFFLQSDQMAINKSKDNLWLTAHVLTYSIVFLIFGWKFALLNGAVHWVVDYITSRITSYLWSIGERHWFFVTIGVDQAIHLTTLVLSIPLIA